MERLKPEGIEPNIAPLIYCSSIQEMLTSRQALIDEINYWLLNEANEYKRLINSLTGEIEAFIDLNSVRHDPNLDLQLSAKKQIALYDISNTPILVNLPNPGILNLINNRRRQSGEATVSSKDLRETFWTANINLYNIYGRDWEKYSLFDINQIALAASEEETAPSQRLIFTAH